MASHNIIVLALISGVGVDLQILFEQIMPLTKQEIPFLYNQTNQMHKFPKFTPAWNPTCFGQFHCPSSGVYSLYSRHWYMSYRFEDSFWAGPGWNIPVSTVQWIDSWWWAEELPETCSVSCWSKFGKFVHLVGFITKKFVTMHGHMNVKEIPCFGLSVTSRSPTISPQRCCPCDISQLQFWAHFFVSCVYCIFDLILS